MNDLATTETTLDERRCIVSLIGKLEQVSLPAIFQRIEQYSKTGVLVVKQQEQWVELYFRDGRLMCIGPVRANTTLGDRLVQAGVITPLMLQEVILTLGEAQLSETRIALTLMDLGYTSGEDLRAWSSKEAADVLTVLLTWKYGELYFEDNLFPSADRLLVSLTISTLLPLTAYSPVATNITQQDQNKQQSAVPIHPPASLSASRLIAEASPVIPASETLEAARPKSTIDLVGDAQVASSSSPSYPQRVTRPLRPIPVDTTSIQPDMVMLPVDLSALREQNPPVTLTPDQWRLLTRADGRTTLKDACSELRMPATVVRQVAGELSVLGLVQMMMPSRSPEGISELSPVSYQLLTSGLGNGYVQPGYAAVAAQPWAASASLFSGVLSTSYGGDSVTTQAQWNNGGNGATFILGQGWFNSPQSIQHDQSYSSGQNMYVRAAGGR
jgi:hypothetical protein